MVTPWKVFAPFHNLCNYSFWSSQDVAADITLLQEEGVTHVLNVATGVEIDRGESSISEERVELLDLPEQTILESKRRADEWWVENIPGQVYIKVQRSWRNVKREATQLLSTATPGWDSPPIFLPPISFFCTRSVGHQQWCWVFWCRSTACLLRRLGRLFSRRGRSSNQMKAFSVSWKASDQLTCLLNFTDFNLPLFLLYFSQFHLILFS